MDVDVGGMCLIDRKMHTLIGHRAEISSAQFNWDCSLIATGSMDKTVKLWDTASGRLYFIITSSLSSSSSSFNFSTYKDKNLTIQMNK